MTPSWVTVWNITQLTALHQGHTFPQWWPTSVDGQCEVGGLNSLAQGWTSLKGQPSSTALMGSATAPTSQYTSSLTNTAPPHPSMGCYSWAPVNLLPQIPDSKSSCQGSTAYNINPPKNLHKKQIQKQQRILLQCLFTRGEITPKSRVWFSMKCATIMLNLNTH